MNDGFDFGFTAVNEEELDVVQKQQSKVEFASNKIADTQNALDKLYNAVIPLLNNLKKNPEKDYILWPNRLAKVEEFEDHLRKIYEG